MGSRIEFNVDSIRICAINAKASTNRRGLEFLDVLFFWFGPSKEIFSSQRGPGSTLSMLIRIYVLPIPLDWKYRW
jgi:hypothetical protein